jgi:hypothetical protein
MELDTLVMNTRAVNENNDIQRLYLTTLEFNRKCVDFINKVKNEWNADF